RLAPVSTSIRRRTPLTIGSTKKCPCESATSVTENGDDGGAGRVSPLVLASYSEVVSARRGRRSAFSCAPVAIRCLGANASVRTIREDQSNFHDLMGPPLSGNACSSQRDLRWFYLARGELPLFGGPRLLVLGISGLPRRDRKQTSRNYLSDARAVVSSIAVKSSSASGIELNVRCSQGIGH